MNLITSFLYDLSVSAGCHINDVMNAIESGPSAAAVSAGCHINDVMNCS